MVAKILISNSHQKFNSQYYDPSDVFMALLR